MYCVYVSDKGRDILIARVNDPQLAVSISAKQSLPTIINP